MLTLEKLKVYRQFGGDIDGGCDGRSAIPRGWRMTTVATRFAFDRVRSAAPEFQRSVEQRLPSATPEESTREALRTLS